MNTIDTDDFSERLRNKALDLSGKRVLITNYHGSQQENDLTEPANCGGFGRIRHFKLKAGEGWPSNPLPIIPAQKYLRLSNTAEMKAQVFQNSVCNWRCWYCYVDFKLLNGDSRYGTLLSCDDLLNLYQEEKFQPLMIDLSGGQPDLTPEWVPWMMEALTARNLHEKVFLWSDDNLSNDYFWRFLTAPQIDLIKAYKMYARVCCFKGIDERSFTLNTRAAPLLFHRQFELFKMLWELKIDLYAYITLTAPSDTDFSSAIPKFIDKVQEIDSNIPLRIVPLRIFEFSPSAGRNNVDKADLLEGQNKAIEVWQTEMEKRFTSTQRAIPICDI